jgi:hypothetical protein
MASFLRKPNSMQATSSFICHKEITDKMCRVSGKTQSSAAVAIRIRNIRICMKYTGTIAICFAAVLWIRLRNNPNVLAGSESKSESEQKVRIRIQIRIQTLL